MDMTPKTSNFCILPFVHSCTNVGGRNKPCCRFKDPAYTDNVPPQEYFHGSKLQELRERMLRNEKIEGCYRCIQDEKNSGVSYRTRANAAYQLEDLSKPEIQFIELGISNACNFACVTCDAAYSTTWWNDVDQVNSIPELKTKKWKPETKVVFTEFEFDNLETVKTVKLLGGEPFMEPRNLELLEKLPLEKIILQIVTNGSFLPNERWLKVLDTVKQAYVDVSVDGMGKTGEFVRYGMNWSKWKRNMKWWYNYRYGEGKDPERIVLGNHFVIHSLNILQFEDYLTWHKEFIGEKLPTTDICTHPEYLDPQFLPKKIKKKILKNTTFEPLQKYLKSKMDNYDPDKCKQLVKYVDRLTEIRGKTHSETIDCLMWELKK